MFFKIPEISYSIIDTLTKVIDKANTEDTQIAVFKEISFKIAAIQNTEKPLLHKPIHLIFLEKQANSKKNNDEIELLLKRKAAINLFNFKDTIKIELLNTSAETTDFKKNKLVQTLYIGKGVHNYLETAAMNEEEYAQGITTGIDLVNSYFNTGSNTISFGSTTNHSNYYFDLITATLTNTAIKDCVNFEENKSDEAQQLLISKINAAKKLHNPLTLPQIMCCYGDYNLITIVGAIIRACELRMVILIDNYITAVALLFAYQLDNHVLDYCLFINTTKHKGYLTIIDYFEKRTLFDFDYKSNTGVGVPLTIPIIQGALHWLNSVL